MGFQARHTTSSQSY